jgi:hypothetical protein
MSSLINTVKSPHVFIALCTRRDCLPDIGRTL